MQTILSHERTPMDIQSIIGQVTESLGAAPEKAQDFLADPKAAIEELTGQTLGEGDIAEIVSGAIQDHDRGIIVVLDPRMVSKSYGRIFLNSIPRCPVEYF